MQGGCTQDVISSSEILSGMNGEDDLIEGPWVTLNDDFPDGTTVSPLPLMTWTHPGSVKNIYYLHGSSVENQWTGVERDTHKTSHSWALLGIFVSSLGLSRIQEGTCSKSWPSGEGRERKGSWC